MMNSDFLPPPTGRFTTPSERPGIQGLHHVTASVGEAQPDLDFHVGILGLRLVKQTVNFDNPGVYHLYYGDATGSPSTLMTTFPYAGNGIPRGVTGHGQVTRTRYAVPPGSLPYWKDRLGAAGVAVTFEDQGLGEPALHLHDPSGLRYALVETAGDDRLPWRSGGNPVVPEEVAIRGLHGVELTVARLEPSVSFARDLLDLAELIREPGRVVLVPSDPGTGRPIDRPGGRLEFRLAGRDTPEGVNGLGTIHHVALAVERPASQQAYRMRLQAAGVTVTEIRDRRYFQSIYFREPGGVLYEIATQGPGFLVDEARESLGRSLCLPAWQEAHRQSIASHLPPLHLP